MLPFLSKEDIEQRINNNIKLYSQIEKINNVMNHNKANSADAKSSAAD